MSKLLDISEFIQRIKSNPNINEAGMILIHNGIVRETSRDGSRVTEIEVKADLDRLQEILAEARKVPGIVAVEAEIVQGTLKVGDDLMLLAVAGDVRENVISTLSSTLNRIKSEVTSKKEKKA